MQWYKISAGIKTLLSNSERKIIDARRLESTITVHITNSDNENGNYTCEIEDPVKLINLSGTVEILVYGAPTLLLDKVVAINTSQVFFNWTIKLYNCPVKNYALYIREKNAEKFQLYNEKVGVKNTSFVINNLNSSTEYGIRLDVSTDCGEEKSVERKIKTLDEVPVFVPNISINGFSATSVTIGWAPPPEHIEHLIHYYLLEARKKDENVTRRAYHARDGNLPYMFDNLEPHSTYIFQVYNSICFIFLSIFFSPSKYAFKFLLIITYFASEVVDSRFYSHRNCSLVYWAAIFQINDSTLVV